MPNDPLFLVAANLFSAFLFRMIKPNIVTATLLAAVMIVSTGYLGAEYGTEILGTVYRCRDAALTYSGSTSSWPPQKHRAYPDLELVDQDGKPHRLSDYRGKVLLIESVGMSCRASIAFAGGHQAGAFQGVTPQENLDSIDACARRYGFVRLDDNRIVHIQIILFNSHMKSPTTNDLKLWAHHFDTQHGENRVVLAGTKGMANLTGRQLIPGFHLVDENFLLRADSTGIDPEDNLYTDLLPMLHRLVRK